MQNSPTPSGQSTEQPSTVKQLTVRYLMILGGLAFAAFWIWALFFASKEGVNSIEDREWAARAQQICEAATVDRLALADGRTIAESGPDAIDERADILESSTDILVVMLDDVMAVEPSDEKGQGIVPLWEADYRIYLQDRYNYSEQLRTTGENLPFYETDIGIPISEKVETFAVDNEMSACAPPHDLTV